MAYDPRRMRTMFDGVAEIYHASRPGYPAALFDDLFELLPPRPRIVEVGPGTGQATSDLLRHGARVDAIEIGPAMGAKLREVLPSEHLTITIGDFEQIPDEPHAFDAVFSATAYHWIEPHAQVDRPAQLLHAGGIVIVDRIQVDDSAQGFFDAAQHIYDRYGEGHTGPPAPTRGEADPAMRQRLEEDARFRRVEVRRYDGDQTYSAAEYRTMMLSYSGTQAMQPAERDGLLDDIEAFINEHFDGRVTRPAIVTLTTATCCG